MVSAVLVGSVSAFAAAGDTVYVRVNNGWSNIHCYMWSDSLGSNATWPGVKMTLVEGDVYSYKVTKNWDKIIFNVGSNANQTADLTYPGKTNQIYDLSKGTWSTYEDAPEDTTSDTTAAVQETTQAATTSSNDTFTVYYKNTKSWSTPYCYMWNSSSDTNAGWPGKAMTLVGDDVWSYTASKNYANCIFSNNSSDQTSDLTARYGYIYENGSWSVYDTSDLQVKSFSADPAGDIYTDMQVTLSAEAVNKNGYAVSYKFSVTNSSGGTSVISDYSSASSVTWTPASVGTYTINYDFKDTAGNENNRSLTLVVKDDSTLTKPIIKSVVPANLNLIKAGENTTVTVSAGGGQTGTNLLFYKYVVTDPNGVQNTPYYTLSNTYTFKPMMEGNYTVNVYVQASDNSTVTKTYTYNASADGPIPTEAPTTAAPTTVAPTTEAVQPTTQAPTAYVQPTTAPSGYEKGDANLDGVVNIKDATYVQMHVAEYPEAQSIIVSVADMSGDGIITVLDATLIQRLLLK